MCCCHRCLCSAPARPGTLKTCARTKTKQRKTKGKHKIDSNQKPEGLRRKRPPFPLNSSTKLKDPWRISNPREEEGRKGKNREGATGRALLHRPSLERRKKERKRVGEGIDI